MGPVGHSVLRDRLVGSPGDEGEEGLGGARATGDRFDDAGEPELVVRREEGGGGPEGKGGDLDPAEDRLGVGQATDDLLLGAKVEVDGVDDVAVDTALLAEAEVGIAAPSDAVEEHEGGIVVPTY